MYDVCLCVCLSAQTFCPRQRPQCLSNILKFGAWVTHVTTKTKFDGQVPRVSAPPLLDPQNRFWMRTSRWSQCTTFQRKVIVNWIFSTTDMIKCKIKVTVCLVLSWVILDLRVGWLHHRPVFSTRQGQNDARSADLSYVSLVQVVMLLSHHVLGLPLFRCSDAVHRVISSFPYSV